jgi:hypothetical protein
MTGFGKPEGFSLFGGRLEWSQHPPLRQRHGLAIANHDMIKQSDIHSGQGFLQAQGDRLVSPARLSDAGRMVGCARQ